MIRHHPADDLLLSLAAGTLSIGATLVVRTHIETCAQCQARLGLFEAVGGVMLEDLPPASLSAQALALTLAAIDQPASAHETPSSRTFERGERPSLPAGMAWPRALEACASTPWRFLAPGMRWSRLRLPSHPDAKLFLLRIGSGRSLPFHTHNGTELTQVLHGAFADGREVFGAGDFDAADHSIHHCPTVAPGADCICFAAVEGKMRFDSPIARAMASLIGM